MKQSAQLQTSKRAPNEKFCNSSTISCSTQEGAAAGGNVAGPLGAIVGGAVGAATGTVGGILGVDDRPRFREYVVRERRPSYRYNEDLRVDVVLPESGITYYDVSSKYRAPAGYRYTIVNDRPAPTASCSNLGLRSRSRASPSTWSSDAGRRARAGAPSCATTRRTLQPWICSSFRLLASTCLGLHHRPFGPPRSGLDQCHSPSNDRMARSPDH